MTYDLLTGLALFAFVASITPGPNNLMLMASGANFGLRRTIPHILGVGLGFVAMVLIVGAGLAQVFQIYPVLNTVLKVLSVIYLLFLAWKIANAAPAGQSAQAGQAEQMGQTGQTGRPLTFLQAAAFQWVNPKAWAMAVTATTVYMPQHSWLTLVTVAMVFGAINLPSVGSWTLLGQEMARFLTNARRLQAFNYTMAAMLVLSLYPVVL